MTTAKDLLTRLNSQLQSKAAAARAFDASYKFILKGEGGGQWVASLRDPVGISESNGPADCTITLAATDFVDLFEGRVNGQQLFFSGRLQIDGDMSLALKLQSVTELFA
jgi:predicted lipid carrier protein YhbT